jgi:hypothetical protein
MSAKSELLITQIVERVFENEKCLKDIKKLSAEEDIPRQEELLASIQGDYRELIVCGYKSSDLKDANTSLWKCCFYRPIEEYRMSIKKVAEVLQKSTLVGPGYDTNTEKSKHKLLRLNSALHGKIALASSFYIDLLLENERILDIPGNDKNIISHNIHKTLIYLGDLERYRVLHLDSTGRNWEVARKYYKRAALVLPNSGAPYNQLAILAVYEHNDILAAFMHCRSVIIGDSFPNGYDNLSIMYKKNMKVHYPSTSVKSGTKNFLSKFVCIHGFFFFWSNNSHEDSSSWPLEDFMSLKQTLIDEFENHLEKSTFSASILIQMFSISLFSLHAYNTIPRGDKNTRAKTITESLALTLLLEYTNKITCRLLKLISRTENLRRVGKFKQLLPTLNIFIDWARNYPQFLRGNETPDLTTDNSENTQFGNLPAPPDIFRLEVRARSVVRATFTYMRDALEKAKVNNCKLDVKNLRIEHLELRGFAPLAEYYELTFANMHPLSEIAATVESEKLSFQRLGSIKDFVSDGLIPKSKHEMSNYRNMQAQTSKQSLPKKDGRKKENTGGTIKSSSLGPRDLVLDPFSRMPLDVNSGNGRSAAVSYEFYNSGVLQAAQGIEPVLQVGQTKKPKTRHRSPVISSKDAPAIPVPLSSPVSTCHDLFGFSTASSSSQRNLTALFNVTVDSTSEQPSIQPEIMSSVHEDSFDDEIICYRPSFRAQKAVASVSATPLIRLDKPQGRDLLHGCSDETGRIR